MLEYLIKGSNTRLTAKQIITSALIIIRIRKMFNFPLRYQSDFKEPVVDDSNIEFKKLNHTALENFIMGSLDLANLVFKRCDKSHFHFFVIVFLIKTKVLGSLLFQSEK